MVEFFTLNDMHVSYLSLSRLRKHHGGGKNVVRATGLEGHYEIKFCNYNSAIVIMKSKHFWLLYNTKPAHPLSLRKKKPGSPIASNWLVEEGTSFFSRDMVHCKLSMYQRMVFHIPTYMGNSNWTGWSIKNETENKRLKVGSGRYERRVLEDLEERFKGFLPSTFSSYVWNYQ